MRRTIVFSAVAAFMSVAPAPSLTLQVRNGSTLASLAEASVGTCPVGVSGCTQLGVGFSDDDVDVVEGHSVHKCRWLCAQTKKGDCAGFTYDFEEGMCYLKKSLNQPEQRESAVSGNKNCLVDGLAGCAAFNIGLLDWNISIVKTHNMQECRHQCLKKGGCEAYTYNHESKRCHMKKTQKHFYKYKSDMTANKHCSFDGTFPCTKLGHKSDALPNKSKTVRTVADCFDMCRDDAGCKFINFEVASKTCHILAEHGKLAEEAGFLFSPIKCSIV